MITKTITSWSELSTITDHFGRSHSNIKWLFRGQSRKDWTLKPSILRILPPEITRSKAHGYENGSVMRFFAEYHLCKGEEIEVDYEQDDVVQLMIMQHYNCPTRLLDWTESFFIALYFAIEDNMNYDGAIYSIPSNILNTNVDKEFGKIKSPYRAYYEIMDKDFIYPIVASAKTRRMATQQGWVTFCNNILADHENVINDYIGNPDNFVKFVVGNNLKKEAIDRLHHMNISAKTLFPGLDGLGRWNKEIMLARSYFEQVTKDVENNA
jgi:hypothetical protein